MATLILLPTNNHDMRVFTWEDLDSEKDHLDHLAKQISQLYFKLVEMCQKTGLPTEGIFLLVRQNVSLNIPYMPDLCAAITEYHQCANDLITNHCLDPQLVYASIYTV